MVTDDNKEFVMGLLGTIKDISDKEYQRRVWIRAEGWEVDDFDETVCCFFEDAEVVLEEPREYGLTESQCQILKNFSDQFEKFSDNNHQPEEFIDTPQWQEIMSLAEGVLKVFNYKADSVC